MNIENNFKRKYDPKTGLEVYDFNTAKKIKNGEPIVVKTCDGWTIFIYPMIDGSAEYEEYSPANEFITCRKEFHSNGRLRQKGYSIQNDLPIGIWEYYDEDGNLIKEINYDEKLDSCKIKIDDVLNILEKEGWIDRKTGKGGTEIVINKDYTYAKHGFNLMFTKDENNKDIWYVNIPITTSFITLYTIDANTGVFTKEEKFIMGYE